MPRAWMCIALATLVFPLEGQAQELVPLRLMNHDRIESSYAFLRCAALHQANLRWAGEERVGADASRYMNDQTSQLLQVVVNIRLSQDGSTRESVEQNTLRDVLNIVAIYVNRFEKNYATTGEAMASDELWRDDFEWCKALGTMFE